ncbi:hypothetical protein [Spirosoma rigui]|uniref:hypothetical protein n=1 Tax=Spirosoma rigui TaxID=564064 RepID=UPI0012D329F2|nr:hypothetical protein [Spirosoma rigui]
MKFTQSLSTILLLWAMGQTIALGQGSLTGTDLSNEEQMAQSAYKPTDVPDSLVAKRSFLLTSVSQLGKRLHRGSILSILEVTPKARQLYQRGQLIKPIGPLLAVAGLAIGYIAIKGTPTTGMARGSRTPSNPYPPDVTVAYTRRNLPLLVGGLGLIAGGLCLIELSNELTAKSIQLYNANVVPRRLSSYLDTIKVGITASGQIGVEAHF